MATKPAAIKAAATKPAATKPAASELPQRDAAEREAAAMKAAIRRAMEETRQSLGTAVDVRLWTKKSPWIAVGAAAAAGLALAVVLRRSANRPAANGDGKDANKPADHKQPEPAKEGIGAKIVSSIFDLAKLGLETAITSGIREATAHRAPPSDVRNETTSTAR